MSDQNEKTEIEKCRDNFAYWTENYVEIVTPQGRQRFQPNEAQRAFMRALETQPLPIVLTTAYAPGRLRCSFIGFRASEGARRIRLVNLNYHGRALIQRIDRYSHPYLTHPIATLS